MESSVARTVLLLCLASALFACATDSLDSTPLWGTSPALELNRLPVGSKVYFRRPVPIPARSGRIRFLSPSEPSALAAELTLEPAELDRVIKTTTPLLVERIASTGAPGARGPCEVRLFLMTSGGESMQLRIEPFGTALVCSRPTIGDIADVTIIVPAPPVPIE